MASRFKLSGPVLRDRMTTTTMTTTTMIPGSWNLQLSVNTIVFPPCIIFFYFVKSKSKWKHLCVISIPWWGPSIVHMHHVLTL